MRAKNKIANISIVNVYASTEETDEEEKDTFLEELGNMCTMITKHDIVILLGGFNGKVEKEAYINDVEHKKKYKVTWLVLEKKIQEIRSILCFLIEKEKE